MKGQRGLTLENVAFRYGDLVVLRDESFHLDRGQVLVVTGENGVGKSTFLYLCAGLLPVMEGEVRLDGHRPDPERPSALVRAGVRCGFVFQDGALIHNLTALANVSVALRFHADVLGMDEKSLDARARAALIEVGVDQPDFHALPAHLSFGVKKRIAMARALALGPNFVFFDDPDTGLDPRTLGLVHLVIERCCADPEITVVIATNHDALVERVGVRPHEIVNGALLELPLPSERVRPGHF